MTQKGEHTWDLVIDYRRCPKCGFIIEDRQEYRHEMGSWIKDVNCVRCGNVFVVKDTQVQAFGPLLGRPQPPEVTWDK